MLKPFHHLFFAFVFFFCPIVLAEDNPSHLKFECSGSEVNIPNNTFKDLEVLAVELDNTICSRYIEFWFRGTGELSEIAVQSQTDIRNFGEKAEKLLADHFSQATSAKNAIEEQFGFWKRYIDTIDWNNAADNNFPQFQVNNNEGEFYSTAIDASTIPDFKRSKIPDNAEESCTSKVPGYDNLGLCTHALEDASQSFNKYETNLKVFRLKINEQKLEDISSSWSAYLDKAKSQTIVDIWATSLLHGDYYSQRVLVAPHSTQFFFLHPQLVYEFNKDAKKGDRAQIALAVEWAGVNWWNAKIPFGVGIISVYADYEEEKTVGTGVQMTINNNISIGWVERGDSEGFFVSMDFLKFWRDKRSLYDQYRKDPLKWFRE